ncbi:MAG: hypothetical protein ACK4IS_12980 [Erythrobacter sp.]
MANYAADDAEADEWISWEAAGKLIDGPDGWQYDERSGKRPSARSLLHLAETGKVRLDALDWTVRVSSGEPSPPTDRQKRRVAGILLTREKRDGVDPDHLAKSHNSATLFRNFDDKHGHFDLLTFASSEDGQSGERHVVHGLRFNRQDIEKFFGIIPARSSETTKATKASGGRPPASWWRLFAEELAIYIYENGIPEGAGADGQDQIIKEIQTRIIEAGEEEPSRTAIQGVVRSVIIRIRSAKK